VAVHWSVSGLECTGSACGTIDDDGTYAPPRSLTRAMVVVLQGVLVADAKHSVLTRIRLEPAASTQVLSGAMQTSADSERAINQDQFSTEVAASQELTLAAQTETSTKPGVEVTYEGGQLTIDAMNTTLADVLESIAEKTGAVIAIPAGSGAEPIAEHVGPGQPNDVLVQLLNGSRFNFVIVSSPQYPFEPEQILLSMRESDALASVRPVQQPEAAAAPKGLPPELLERLFSRKRQPGADIQPRPGSRDAQRQPSSGDVQQQPGSDAQ
jgi:hypothetical protein